MSVIHCSYFNMYIFQQLESIRYEIRYLITLGSTEVQGAERSRKHDELPLASSPLHFN
jgi:hypothetical protein